MRAILQRVAHASVEVEGTKVGEIDRGLLVLVGVATGDDADDVAWIARKLTELRIFPDDAGRMNRSVLEVGGAVLLVSQFTLHADVRRGRRPSFVAAASPDEAVPLLDELRRAIEAAGVMVETGRFGAHMRVSLLNDGPVTIPLDSAERPRREGPANPPAPERYRWLGAGGVLTSRRLVLASASPRRSALLSELGLAFEIVPADVDERDGIPDEPEAHARAVAERKARAVATLRPDDIVLAADTIVVLGSRIFGKPSDDEDAFAMLRALAGREHRVLTAVCVAHAARDHWRTRVVSTSVRFRPADDAELRRYVASGEPHGKAGAYAIQGLGGLLVAGIDGDYSNVVGLPQGDTIDLLAEVLAR